MKKVYVWLVALGIAFYGVNSNAEAESVAPVVYGNHNVEKLAEDLQQLQKFVYRSLGPDQLHHPVSEAGAEGVTKAQVDLLQNKVETLSQEIPTLVDRTEQAEHTSQKLLENNKTFVQYINHFQKKLEELEAENQLLKEQLASLQTAPQSLSSLPKQEVEAHPGEIPAPPPLEQAQETPPVVEVEEPQQEEPAVELSPEELEKKARAELIGGQYDEARTSFEKLLEKDLDKEKAAPVHFYLGEISSFKKDLPKASEHYLASFQGDPNCARAPKSLLKLSIVLHDLGKEKAACASLDKVLSDYPKASSDILDMAKAKRKEYACTA